MVENWEWFTKRIHLKLCLYVFQRENVFTGLWQLRGQFPLHRNIIPLECLPAVLTFAVPPPFRISQSFTSPIPSSCWTWCQSWRSRTCLWFRTLRRRGRRWRNSGRLWTQPGGRCKWCAQQPAPFSLLIRHHLKPSPSLYIAVCAHVKWKQGGEDSPAD